jgi:hypothetical protein
MNGNTAVAIQQDDGEYLPADAGAETSTARARALSIVFKRIARGDSVIAVCKGGNGAPGFSTFWDWIAEDKQQLALYEAAMVMRAHVFAEQLTAMADDSTGDYVTRVDKDGNEYTVINPDNIQRSKLMVNTRQWIVSKLIPRKYGDKLTLGGDPDSPIRVVISPADDKL